VRFPDYEQIDFQTAGPVYSFVKISSARLMQPLRHNDTGPAVQQIQTALNFAGPTRLPRLPIDGTFGALTVGRVMEFQFRNGRTTDGVVGPITNAKLPQDGPGNGQQPDVPSGRSILVNLFDRQLTAYKTGMRRCKSIRSQVGGPDFCLPAGYSR
jgi:peptidoglycan hydrolase-like protein with peptidoglycan-binding domain